MKPLPEIFCPSCLEGNLVSLTLLKADDFEKLFAAASDPLIWEKHTSQDRYKKDVFRKFFESALEIKSSFLVSERESGAVIGSTRYYEYSEKTDSVCIGYTFLKREFWGGTYNGEMKKLMLDYAFQYVSLVLFHISADNQRSYKAAEKTGARKIRDFTVEKGDLQVPYFEYGIRKEEWIH